MEALEAVALSPLAMEAQDHVTKECTATYRCAQMQLYGKRCAKVVFLFYNPSNKLFYEATPDNIKRASAGNNNNGQSSPIGPFIFIQNSKLGFYIQQQSITGSRGQVSDVAIIEYFRDSYEGWYINKYIHGHRQAMTNSESAKFCQCRWALEINTTSFQQAIEKASK